MRKAVTVTDVARHAGVSAMTVSKALNGRDRISEETRARVLAAASELGYVANAAARSLRGGRTDLLGLLVQDLSNQYFAEIVRGASEAIRERGLDLVLYTSSNDPERERQRVATLSSGVSDGLIIVAPHGSPGLLEQLQHSRVPVVLINAWNVDDLPTVNPENRLGARAATEHLLALGHRRIGFVTGRPDSPLSPERPDGVMRLQGYREALVAAGVAFDPTLLHPGGLHLPLGREAGHDLLALPDPPTAIFAANDFCAFGVIEAARERGLRVPEDLSVVGFDDVPMAGQVQPALTTVHHPLHDLGHRAATLLLDLLADHAPERHVELPSRLIVRDSTAPPA
ncbi:LacI family transcriptional regulator (plasmid) [Deinococcus aetherius]|uniref:LacI family transcriptional regulator n=1 Tax=Deinococcus aetherius TaxID=200252 RepID=A0ABM8AJF1_9DEIO|nr:LacI family DNA-binding transcriptional regulator [Deinococcus aetherius]BDP43944.1 LacI family transcriptional regulator [Deinococcus aetherius]